MREDDLAVLVGEAAAFVEKECARATKRARRHRDGRPRSEAHLCITTAPDSFCDNSLTCVEMGYAASVCQVSDVFLAQQGCC